MRIDTVGTPAKNSDDPELGSLFQPQASPVYDAHQRDGLAGTQFMRITHTYILGALFLAACGGGQPADSPANASDSSGGEAQDEAAPTTGAAASESEVDGEFALKDSDSAGSAHGATESKIRPSKTEAAMKFFMVDKESNKAIPGVVISLTSPDGKKYFTGETDEAGYAEVLVPVGKKYELVYLSLGRRDISARVPVSDEPNQNIKLTLRYKKRVPKPRPKKATGGAGLDEVQPGFVLKGVEFDTGKATIRPDSFPRLASVLEYMTHKKSARIEITGHTDNVGQPASNKKLSNERAEACKKYLIEKGIDGSRIEAVGYGDEQPVAPNTTKEGRQQNRRIEAREL